MNTREIAVEYRLAHWSQIMQGRKERGQSIRAYCEDMGLHENVYYYWQRKLREATYEQLSENKEEKPTLPAFTEVKLASHTPQQLDQVDSFCGEIRIETADVRITTNSTFPMEALAVLLREMTRPC